MYPARTLSAVWGGIVIVALEFECVFDESVDDVEEEGETSDGKIVGSSMISSIVSSGRESAVIFDRRELLLHMWRHGHIAIIVQIRYSFRHSDSEDSAVICKVNVSMSN